MLEKRRAYVEYISKKSVQITTPFRQKSFNLTDDCFIDLISLKILPRGSKSYFFVEFSYDEEEDSYVGEVHCLIAKGRHDIIENMDFQRKAVDIRTTVWVDA